VASLPEVVERFLLEQVSAVGDLEVLLHLRMHAQRSWSAQAIAAELRSSALAANQAATRLASRHLLRYGEDGWKYAASPEIDAAVSEVERIYRERPVSVMAAILSKPDASVRLFAEAFRVRPKREP
jgi:hypothetical protein